MQIKDLYIDDDLTDYLSSKDNVEKFINFCIRERYEAEIKMSMRKVRKPSREDLAARKYESSTLQPLSAEDVQNPDTPFFLKKVVITGQFYTFPERNDLGKLLQQYGADMNTSISKKTNIVIIGYGAGPKKKDKVKDLQGQGYNIITYDEQQLLLEFDKYEIPYEKII